MEPYQRKTFYQDKVVAESYLDQRFSSPKGRREHRETRTALERALEKISGVESILDVPCGNGRFFTLLRGRGYRYVGADISMEMLEVMSRGERQDANPISLVRCDGEYLPFKEDAFDCVACIRFLNLVPLAIRQKILREMIRVSRKWLIVQSHHLKTMGPLTRLKMMGRRIMGCNLRKYELQKDILGAGWIEEARVPIRGTGHYIGIYRKTRIGTNL